jgi:peroxiredoxin
MRAISILLLAILSLSFYAFRPNSSLIGKQVHDFHLKNVTRQAISLSEYKNAKGFIVVFTCNHCPFAKLYATRFNELNNKYKALDVPLLAINSMDTTVYEEETFALMQAKAMEEAFSFPYLYDNMQVVGKDFQAKHTPHAYVIWKHDDKWIIEYSGAIDDNGEHPELAHSYLSDAVDELLDGKRVTVPETASFGCAIFYRKGK